MKKHRLKQAGITGLASLLFLSSALPATAGSMEDLYEDLFPELSDEESSLEVSPSLFNQSFEEALHISYEEGIEDVSLGLFEEESGTLLGELEVTPIDATKAAWEFQVTQEDVTEEVILEDQRYFIEVLTDEEAEEEIETAQVSFVHYSELPVLSWEESEELEELELGGQAYSALQEFGLDPGELSLSFEAEGLEEAEEVSIEEDGSFNVDVSFLSETTSLYFTLADPLGNTLEEEKLVTIEEDTDTSFEEENADADESTLENEEDASPAEEEITEAKESEETALEEETEKKEESSNEEETDVSEENTSTEEVVNEEKNEDVSEEEELTSEETTEKEKSTEKSSNEEETDVSEENTSTEDVVNEEKNEDVSEEEELTSKETTEKEKSTEKSSTEEETDVSEENTSTEDIVNEENTDAAKSTAENEEAVNETTASEETEETFSTFSTFSMQATEAPAEEYYDGASGEYIRELKFDLTALGFGNFPSYPSTRFGPVTMGVVEDFQRAYGLPVTGIPDQATLDAIENALNEETKETISSFSTQATKASEGEFYDGASGEYIRELKLDLTALGFGNFPSYPSTRFGPVTMGVVEDFQKANGLNITGIPDSITLKTIDSALNSNFYSGATGDYVTDLKINLTKLGFGNFPESPSSLFGPVTMSVVEDFQKAHGLAVTGIPDAATLDAMNVALSTTFYNGASGEYVRNLKLDLTKLGFGSFPESPSSLFGPVTMSVVEDFQKAHGLAVTGIPDAATLDAMNVALSTTFYNGASGEYVRNLKLDLTKLGFGSFPESPSSLFGPVTMRVVEDFQKAKGLAATGIPDTATLQAMDLALKTAFYNGASGEHVRTLKLDLTKLGYGSFPSSPSAAFGNVTMKVVEDFQKANNLKVTGIPDSATLKSINDQLEILANTTYEPGSSGVHVQELKKKLTLLGFGSFPSNPSIYYGSVTKKVVEEFQKYYGVKVTGIGDKSTFNKIEELFKSPLSPGNSNTQTVELKNNLTKLGYGSFPTNPSRVYGSVTSSVVKDFQKKNSLAINGIADGPTLQKINSQLNNQPKEEIKPVVIETGEVTATALNIRSGPGTSHDRVGTLTNGTVVEILGEESGWYLIKFDGGTAYASGSFIDTTKKEAAPKVIDTGKVTATTLNIRSGPGTSHDRVGTLTNGTVVEILGEENGWYLIKFDGGTAYASGSFIDTSKLPAPGNDFTGSSIIAYTNGSSLNVRSGPSTAYRVLDNLGSNTRVEIISTRASSGSDTWHQIRYDGGKTGFVSAGYLQLATKASARTGPLAGKKIVLDAGHGGHDSGGIGGGMLEKDVVLDITNRAEELLRAAGAEVIMLRRTDFFLALGQRSFMANRSGADVFLSIHTNMFNGQARGTETFWHDRYERSNSIRLANAVQDATVAKMGTHYRRVDYGNYSVIRQTEIPSALLEIGFKDHPDDAAKLRSNTYRQRAAEAIRDGMINYFK
ncbi:peptidoglycan-binding protein [Alkalicoccus daliensis]|uniref:N-acetylmuramoyl-L-alanine amidase n=1 Tax=Alkalicoccus daliensis TaxID=745820 RepID=A0A1H0GJA1_9BACI|nr:peptidoglycan-binding protein [Alkalicoccus daliensis]SDO06910.1 N-acetylmuramoyl-L-alanine amidase [Alkalicoccus daliensis]